MQQSKTDRHLSNYRHLLAQSEEASGFWRLLQSWVRRHRWAMIVMLVLVFFGILPGLFQSLPPPSMQGLGGVGGTVTTPAPVPVPGPISQGPSGQFCGTIVVVLTHFGLTAKDMHNGQITFAIPGSSQIDPHFPPVTVAPYLTPLPLPDTTKDLTYNPKTQQTCASNAVGKQVLSQWLRNILQKIIQDTVVNTTVAGINNAVSPTQWVTNAISGFFDTFWRDCVGFLQAQIANVGFIWITPPDLTYRNTVVLDGADWALEALDGYVALLLVVGGYQLLLNRSLGLEERTSVMGVGLRVTFTAIIANTGFFLFLPAVIDLSNSMSMGIMAAMLHAASGDVSLPLGAINWIEQPISWGIFILIDFVVSLFFIAVQAVRLAVLDLTILLAPLWIMALANEYSRSWGKLGATTFFSALLVQPIQVACVSIGSALITNFGKLNPVDPAICQHVPIAARATCITQLGNTYLSNSMNLAVLILGISTLYVAIKIPGMFFSSAIRASVGSVNGDIGKVARSAMSFMMFQKNLGA